MLKELPLRMHHHAYAVKDQEANRHFIEDILGIPLVATWCERTFRPEVGREVDYCHTFFEIADGGALAFFQYRRRRGVREKPRDPAGGWRLLAHGAESHARQLRRTATPLRDRRRAGPHDRSRLLPVHVPENADGLRLEFTVDAPDAERIAAMRRADAHSELARWLAGDRHVNNDDRPH